MSSLTVLDDCRDLADQTAKSKDDIYELQAVPEKYLFVRRAGS